MIFFSRWIMSILTRRIRQQESFKHGNTPATMISAWYKTFKLRQKNSLTCSNKWIFKIQLHSATGTFLIHRWFAQLQSKYEKKRRTGVNAKHKFPCAWSWWLHGNESYQNSIIQDVPQPLQWRTEIEYSNLENYGKVHRLEKEVS